MRFTGLAGEETFLPALCKNWALLSPVLWGGSFPGLRFFSSHTCAATESVFCRMPIGDPPRSLRFSQIHSSADSHCLATLGSKLHLFSSGRLPGSTWISPRYATAWRLSPSRKPKLFCVSKITRLSCLMPVSSKPVFHIFYLWGFVVVWVFYVVLGRRMSSHCYFIWPSSRNL